MNAISAKEVLKVIVAILAVLGSLYGLDTYIDRKIQSKVSDPQFRSTIASTIRPSVIFDANETVLVDLGGMQFIDSIRVTERDQENALVPTRIIVKRKHYLAYPPLLSSISLNDFRITPKRGKGFDWQFNLDPVSILLVDSNNLPSFRLEIVQ